VGGIETCPFLMGLVIATPGISQKFIRIFPPKGLGDLWNPAISGMMSPQIVESSCIRNQLVEWLPEAGKRIGKNCAV
jgi:hypothetical protein